MDQMKELLSSYQLICIDEFELDDPGNTMIISNLITFLIQNDCFIVTTSNTVPEELGQGRFNVKDFRNEVGRIKESFRIVQIDGDDYRKKDHDITYEIRSNVLTPNDDPIQFDDLIQVLRGKSTLEIIEYSRSKTNWSIARLTPISNEEIALRFSHFIDKIYDFNHQLKLEFEDSEVLFEESLFESSFIKKYKRCISRVFELTQNLTD